MTLSNTTVVGALKEAYLAKLEGESAIPVNLMRVFFGGKELKDEETLIKAGIRRNMVV
jgi:hypothetical protein